MEDAINSGSIPQERMPGAVHHFGIATALNKADEAMAAGIADSVPEFMGKYWLPVMRDGVVSMDEAMTMKAIETHARETGIQLSDPSTWGTLWNRIQSLPLPQQIGLGLGLVTAVIGGIMAVTGESPWAGVMTMLLGGLGMAYGAGAFNKFLGLEGCNLGSDAPAPPADAETTIPVNPPTGPPYGGAAAGAAAGAAGAAGGGPVPGNVGGGGPAAGAPTPAGAQPATMDQAAAVRAGNAATGAPPEQPRDVVGRGMAPIDIAELGQMLGRKHPWVDRFGGAGGDPNVVDAPADIEALMTQWAKGKIPDARMQILIADLPGPVKQELAQQLRQRRGLFHPEDARLPAFGRPPMSQYKKMMGMLG
jgi:hypothetical protein